MISQCYSNTLRKAANRIATLYEAALAPFGLTVAQYELLRMVERRGPSLVSALAKGAEVSHDYMHETISSVMDINLLQKHDYGPEVDYVVVLTGTGVFMLNQTRPVWEACQTDIMNILGSEAVRILEVILDQF